MFDGAPVDADSLASLGAGLERRGPDGGREVIADAVGMTYRAFHTNTESRRERQPLCWGHHAVLCLDGRLDNRGDLVSELRDELRGNDTDAAIAMAAFLKWRVNGFARLVGDFALAIWDRRDHAVWLVRDCVGARTLYYHLDRQRLVWSTDLAALLDEMNRPVEIDDEYIADLLTRGVGPDLTPYVGIHAVKPAHALRIGVDGLTSEHQFWSLDVNREIRNRTDAEYEEHFRSVFCEAVRCRLRSDRTVFAELSGGLDSSSITCVAHNLIQRREAAAPGLETVSYVFDDAPTSDERKWISHVDEWRGATGLRFLDRDYPWPQPLDDPSGIALPNSVFFSSAYAAGLRDAMRVRGARVVLSGTGGDELLHSRNNPMPELADLVASRRFVSLHRRLRVWSSLLRRPYADLLWNDAVVPNLPVSVQVRLESTATRQIPDWLDEHFVDRMQLRKRIVARAWEPGALRPSARIQARAFRIVSAAVGNGLHQELGGCEMAFPYADRRLIEFLQAIPADQRIRCGQSRSIMRRGLRGLVPDAILNRRGKGDPSEVAFRGLRREAERWRALLGDSRIARRGYVDAQMFRAALDRAMEGREHHSGRLLTLLTIELWLRATEHRSATQRSVAAAGVRAAVPAVTTGEAAL